MANSRNFRLLRVVLGSALLILLFAFLLRRGGFPVVPPKADLSQVAPSVVIGYSLAWAGILLVRSLRWRYLLLPIANVPWWRVIAVSLVGFGALAVFPLRLGEAVRPTLIRRGGIGWWEAAGTVGAERVMDGLFLTATLAVALFSTTWLTPLPNHIGALKVPVAAVPGATTGALVMFATLFVMIGLFYWSREFTQRLIEHTVGRVSAGASAWIITVMSRIASGLSFLPLMRYMLPFLAWTCVYWVVNATALMWLMRGCGLTSSTLGQAWVAMGILGLGVVIPNAPGFFGAFQLSLFAGLALFFPTDVITSTGAVFVFYAYVIQVGMTAVLALCAWLFSSWYELKSGSVIEASPKV